jgi:hypothetical protein
MIELPWAEQIAYYGARAAEYDVTAYVAAHLDRGADRVVDGQFLGGPVEGWPAARTSARWCMTPARSHRAQSSGPRGSSPAPSEPSFGQSATICRRAATARANSTRSRPNDHQPSQK